MDRQTRSILEQMTQEVRRLLEREFQEQLEGVFDIPASGKVPSKVGAHLSPEQSATRRKIVEAIEHKVAAGLDAPAKRRI